MNILFANYGDFSTNSLNHIGPFANYLSELGHNCIVAIPSKLESIANIEKALFQPATFGDILDVPNHFPNSKPADIVHAWTPRISVVEFVERYLAKYPSKVVTHLEDNERALIESYYRQSFEKLRDQGLPPDFHQWDESLSHPVGHTAFLALSDGVTAVTESLLDFAFPDQPSMELLPGLPEQHYPSAEELLDLRKQLGIADDEKVLVYPGSITSSNREDVRSLYLAVKLLRERGLNVRLVKTGPNVERFKRSFAYDLTESVLDLGIVPKKLIPKLLAMANLLVQPGKADKVNRYRLPSKLPEFLDAGKPIVTAKANIGLLMTEGEHCLFIHESSPTEIADACQRILTSTALAKRLSENGAAFAKAHFDLAKQGKSLLAFYERISASEKSNWQRAAPDQSPLSTSLPLRLADIATSKALDDNWRHIHRQRILDIAKTVSQLVSQDKIRIQSLETDLERTQRAVESSEQVGRRKAEELASAAESESASARETITRLEAEIKNARRDLQLLTDASARMKSTASWRLTMPLRALRRAFFDREKTASRVELASKNSTRDSTPPFPLDTQRDSPPESPALRDYSSYCSMLEPLVAQYSSNFQRRLPTLAKKPLISILLPVYNVDEIWLRKAIESVLQQIYPHWQLCIADDASTRPHIRETLAAYQKSDDRIQVVFRDTNGHISEASNSALEIAKGDYIALFDHDDELAAHALARVADRINERPDALLIYTDEDKIDEAGNRSKPHFKSDWNPDLLLGQNYISHLGVYRTELVREVGGFRKSYEGAQDWDLALRVSERCKPDQIQHIPEALYHWRSIAGSTASDIDEKSYAHRAGGDALKSYFDRRGYPVTLEPIERFYWRVRYPIPEPVPLVSIIVPTRDRGDLLRTCIESIHSSTTYPRYEIIIADNDSRDLSTLALLESYAKQGIRVLPCPGPFNYSAIINRAIENSKGDIVCTLNNDVTVITPDWLEEMVSHACRLSIGMVGAKLQYPHNHLQHAGIVLGIGGVGSEAFKKIHISDDGYVHRACLIGGYSAVTGACMVFRKSVWAELEGFNEVETPNAYSDVDFCLRGGEKGYRVLFTPFAQLYHHESASRGAETEPGRAEGFRAASDYMHARWQSLIARDPFYNPNLTLRREDFSFCEYPRDYAVD